MIFIFVRVGKLLGIYISSVAMMPWHLVREVIVTAVMVRRVRIIVGDRVMRVRVVRLLGLIGHQRLVGIESVVIGWKVAW